MQKTCGATKQGEWILKWMTSVAPGSPPLSYYDGLADELDQISQAVRNNPKLNDHFAERLKDLAQQLRDDSKLMRIKVPQN